MKSLNLQIFIKEILRSDAVIIRRGSFCDLISYNGYFSVSKYCHFIEELCQNAVFSFIDCILEIKCDSAAYHDCIKKQIRDLKYEFVNHYNGFLCHRRLKLVDSEDHNILCDELDSSVQEKIARFVSEQKISIENFLAKIDNSSPQIQQSKLKWLASKTDLVELGNALYEGGIIGSHNTNITKKEFMQELSSFLGIQLGPTEKTISKAMLRTNPCQFLDRLKHMLTDYYGKQINI